MLSIDRKGRPPEHMEHPALTLLLTAQPAVLAAIARNRAFRGRGLLARFLYAIPESNIGRRKIGAAPVGEDVTENYEQHVRKLAEDLSGWTDPAVLQLDANAHELLLATERMIEPQLAEDGQLGTGLLAEWGSKLAGAMLRIGGLLHLATEGEAFRTPITPRPPSPRPSGSAPTSLSTPAPPSDCWVRRTPATRPTCSTTSPARASPSSPSAACTWSFPAVASPPLTT